jgi:hypothetical protein
MALDPCRVPFCPQLEVCDKKKCGFANASWLLSNRPGNCQNVRMRIEMRPLALSRATADAYKGIADTFVQLFPLRSAGLIASVDRVFQRF